MQAISFLSFLICLCLHCLLFWRWLILGQHLTYFKPLIHCYTCCLLNEQQLEECLVLLLTFRNVLFQQNILPIQSNAALSYPLQLTVSFNVFDASFFTRTLHCAFNFFAHFITVRSKDPFPKVLTWLCSRFYREINLVQSSTAVLL